MVLPVGNQLSISGYGRLIMVSLVPTEVSEKESRRHLRYMEEKILKAEDPRPCHLNTRPGASAQWWAA